MLSCTGLKTSVLLLPDTVILLPYIHKSAWLYKGCTGTDSSLERVLALTSKAALLGVDQQRLAQAQQACVSRNMAAASALQAALHAAPFSMDIFRLRLLDAKRLGLGHEVQSSHGQHPYTTHWQPASPTYITCAVACSMLDAIPLFAAAA